MRVEVVLSASIQLFSAMLTKLQNCLCDSNRGDRVDIVWERFSPYVYWESKYILFVCLLCHLSVNTVNVRTTSSFQIAHIPSKYTLWRVITKNHITTFRWSLEKIWAIWRNSSCPYIGQRLPKWCVQLAVSGHVNLVTCHVNALVSLAFGGLDTQGMAEVSALKSSTFAYLSGGKYDGTKRRQNEDSPNTVPAAQVTYKAGERERNMYRKEWILAY